jgi:hypothetical protein
MDFGDNGYQVPRWLRFTLAALMLCLFFSVAYFVYRFNFTTTHTGLFPGAARHSGQHDQGAVYQLWP